MFIISEISPQFGPDLDIAEQMILQSKMGGANAVKVQLYPTELFFPDGDRYVKSRELDFDAFKRLHAYAERMGIPLFATAFTADRLEWCLAVDQKFYKVAARQHRENPDLVRKILAVGRPTFVSVPHDMDASQIERQPHCKYLYCIPKYPTLVEEVFLPDFHKGLYDGISDHTIGVAAALAAAAHGAQVLEKHYTISYSWQRSNEKGHLGAMTMDDLRLLRTIAADFQRIRMPNR